MNAEAAAALIDEKGIFGLSDYDGCLCANFSVHGINVDVSCRKSCGGLHYIDSRFFGIVLRVHSTHLDAGAKDLNIVAEAVRRKLASEGDDIYTRLCSYEDDNKQHCLHCHSPRSGAAYYCSTCLKMIADDYTPLSGITPASGDANA